MTKLYTSKPPLSPEVETTLTEPLGSFAETSVFKDIDSAERPPEKPTWKTVPTPSGRPSFVSPASAPVVFSSSGAVYDTKEKKDKEPDPPLEELYHDAAEESQRLAEAIEEYEKSLGKDPKKTSVFKERPHTWGDVLREVENASSQYSDPGGTWGEIRKAFRKSGEKVGPASAWLAMLPSQSEYFSVFCGGLKVIIGAASRLNDLRQDIAQALIKIPLLLSCVNRAQNVNKSSKELHRASSDLFVAAIALLEHILRYYRKKPASKSNESSCIIQPLLCINVMTMIPTFVEKVVGAFLRQDDYERNLTGRLDMLIFRSEHFDRVAFMCCYEGVENARTKLEVLGASADQANTALHQHLYLARKEYHDLYEDMITRNMDFQNRLAERLESYAELFASHPRLDPNTQDIRPPQLPVRKTLSAPALERLREHAEQDCLVSLRWKSTNAQTDILKNLRCVYQMPKSAQDRVIAIIRHHRLKSWLADSKSSALFLNGHHTSSGPITQNPTSFVCAKLASSVQGPKNTAKEPSLEPQIKGIAISFFCAEHLDRNDPYRGAKCILQSLIAQLLVKHCEFDTWVMEELQKADLDDLETLCFEFEKLVCKLPGEVILFCIVDAVTIHEESESRCKKVASVIQTLADLTDSNNDRKCVFKLLLTSPRVSRKYSRKVDKRNNAGVLTMPEKVPSQGAFTATKWNSYMSANQS